MSDLSLARRIDGINSVWECSKTPLPFREDTPTLNQLMIQPTPSFDTEPKTTKYSYTAGVIRTFWEPVLAEGYALVRENKGTSVLKTARSEASLPSIATSSPQEAASLVVESINKIMGQDFQMRMDSNVLSTSVPNRVEAAIKRSDLKRYILNAIGGSNEGVAIIGMGFKSAFEDEERPSPQAVKEYMEQSSANILAPARFSFFPQKILDHLVAFGVNPFYRRDGRADIQEEVLEFIEKIGEVTVKPWVQFRSADDIDTFMEITRAIPSTFFKDQNLDPEREGIEYAQLRLSIPPANLYMYEVAGMDELLEAQGKAEEDKLGNKMGLTLKIMETVASYHEIPGQREVLGCPAVHAGVLNSWYRFNSKIFTDWYEMEYDRARIR